MISGRKSMESKRKVNGGVSAVGEDVEDRAAKRRKLPNDNTITTQNETAETTTQHGLRLLEIVRRTEDKSGRPVATAFLKLPSKRELPDYYQITKMPIALDTIEAKLHRHEFPTLTTLESYFKRMVSNAKEYNEKGSLVYEDAERIRKALSNFMTKTNPAYKTHGYVAFPTPLPETKVEAALSDEELEDEAEQDAKLSNKKRGRPFKTPQAQALRAGATSAHSEYQYADVEYGELDFQQAQEKIVEDLLREKKKQDDDAVRFVDFIDLPEKSLRDYYKVIVNPMSLAVLQKRVKGSNNKRESTSVSEYKHWAAFEEAASLLWENAWHYNEDGSFIYDRATELKSSFSKYLKEAKKAVPEPAGPPKIKLKLSESALAEKDQKKITLKFGANKESPAASPAPQTNGSSNGNTSAVNGTTRRNPFGGSHISATPIAGLDPVGTARSASGSVSSPTPSNVAPVKNEEAARNSPTVSGLNGYRGGSQFFATPGAVMAPPLTPGLSNQSGLPSAGYAQSFPHQLQYQAQNPNFESKWRQPGQDASDAMITNLSLATHPGLNISSHFRMDLPPSPTMTHQSVTVNLPPTHYYLQIKPTIASSLLERQYKLFVTSGHRLHAMPTIPGHAVDQRHPLFEARLLPGVNRIEVELIAALPKGAKPVNGQDYDLEKITVFANLMRAGAL